MKNEFVQSVIKNRGIIHKICDAYCFNNEDKKDLFQEILERLWLSFSTFKGESLFTTWMYRVALNTALNYTRELKKDSKITPRIYNDIESWIDIEYESDVEDQVRDLYHAINILEDIDKSIVLLYLDKKSYDEMADILSMKSSTIRVRMSRIRSKLRKEMNELG